MSATSASACGSRSRGGRLGCWGGCRTRGRRRRGHGMQNTCLTNSRATLRCHCSRIAVQAELLLHRCGQHCTAALTLPTALLTHWRCGRNRAKLRVLSGHLSPLCGFMHQSECGSRPQVTITSRCVVSSGRASCRIAILATFDTFAWYFTET